MPGDLILIPPGATTPQSVDSSEPGVVATICLYTIVEGDNPSRIADRFDISVLDLQAVNAESVLSSFLIGSQLLIPGVTDCS